MDTSALKYATIALAIVAAVFLGVAAVVHTINVDAVPLVFQGAIVTLQTIFAMPAVVFITTWVRNVYGYYRAKVKVTAQEVVYDKNKLYQTIGLYVAAGVTFTMLLPEPYNSVGVAFVFVADLVLSEIGYLLNKTTSVVST